jgi:predicted nucleotidyltransferase
MPDARLILPERYWQQLTPLLRQYAPQAEVLAYGSRVSGNCHDTSDLDLVLRNPDAPEQRQENLAALRQAVSESNIPILVDLMDWALIPQSFRDEISRRHCLLPLADHATTILTEGVPREPFPLSRAQGVNSK